MDYCSAFMLFLYCLSMSIYLFLDCNDNSFLSRFDIKFHTSGFGSGDWRRILTWWTMVVLRIVVYGWLQTDGRYWPQSIRLGQLIVPLCLLLPPPPLQQWTIEATVNQTKEPTSATWKCPVQFESGEKRYKF